MSDSPVLLVHGFASSWERNWRELGWVDLLQEAGRTVIPFDLPGHGQAAKPHDPAAYADMEATILSSLPDEPVDAIGFSLGARLLLGAASQSPERFNRIVVGGAGANVFGSDDEGDGSERIARAIERGEPSPGDPVTAGAFARFAQADGNDPAALAAVLRRPRGPLTREEVARIDRPVLVVLGDKDFAGPADPLVAALSNARLVTLPGVDHFATPKAFGFIDAALDFLGAGVG